MPTNSPNPPTPHGRRFRKLPPGATDPDVRRAAVLKLIETRGLRPRSAALAAGIPSSSWYEMLEADRALQGDCEMALARFESAIVGSILKDGIALRSWRAKLEILRAVAPHWIPAQKLDMTVDLTLEDQMAETMTEDELGERMQRIIDEGMRRNMERRQGAES